MVFRFKKFAAQFFRSRKSVEVSLAPERGWHRPNHPGRPAGAERLPTCAFGGRTWYNRVAWTLGADGRASLGEQLKDPSRTCAAPPSRRYVLHKHEVQRRAFETSPSWEVVSWSQPKGGHPPKWVARSAGGARFQTYVEAADRQIVKSEKPRCGDEQRKGVRASIGDPR